jgi:hypothetical protein
MKPQINTDERRLVIRVFAFINPLFIKLGGKEGGI